MIRPQPIPVYLFADPSPRSISRWFSQVLETRAMRCRIPAVVQSVRFNPARPLDAHGEGGKDIANQAYVRSYFFY